MPPPAAAKLDDFLCFAIYTANLAYGRAYKPILEALGLTSYTQFIAIVALFEEEDQTVNGLGDKLYLESNTLTPILKKLEQLGLVTRRRDPADERQVRVSLTDAGRALRERAYALSLKDATGLGDEFGKTQKSVVKLRENLLEAVRTGNLPTKV